MERSGILPGVCDFTFFGRTLKHVTLLFNNSPTITLHYLLICIFQWLITTLDEECTTRLEQTVEFLEKAPGIFYMME